MGINVAGKVKKKEAKNKDNEIKQRSLWVKSLRGATENRSIIAIAIFEGKETIL